MTYHRSDEYNDHRRDSLKHEWRPGDPVATPEQRLAVAELVGYCEGIAASGILSEADEAKLRIRIAGALAAFRMPSRAEIVR